MKWHFKSMSGFVYIGFTPFSYFNWNIRSAYKTHAKYMHTSKCSYSKKYSKHCKNQTKQKHITQLSISSVFCVVKTWLKLRYPNLCKGILSYAFTYNIYIRMRVKSTFFLNFNFTLFDIFSCEIGVKIELTNIKSFIKCSLRWTYVAW